MRHLQFYFDYISPNAYIAWEALKPLADRYGLDVKPIPVLFAGLLGASGRLGPAEYEPMRQWMFASVLRKCQVLDIPISPPAAHPFNPLSLLRLTALDMEDAPRAALIDRLFAAVWAHGKDIGNPNVLQALLHEGGFDGQRMLRDIVTDDAKIRIRNNTDAAIASGVFGVPSMIVEGALFYGYDDFPYMCRLLDGQDPLDRETIEAWSGVKPSAVRRR